MHAITFAAGVNKLKIAFGVEIIIVSEKKMCRASDKTAVFYWFALAKRNVRFGCAKKSFHKC